MRDFTDALERIVLGAERKILMTSDDRRRTAYHEAGHAVVGMLTPGADPVRKVSIIPRSQALGVTFSAPDVDRLTYDEQDLLARIRRFAGCGRDVGGFDHAVEGRVVGPTGWTPKLGRSDVERMSEAARAGPAGTATKSANADIGRLLVLAGPH